ncbi:MAG: class I SAM-dependent DNA methyltransferase [Clostridia bacterium]|nr:class I SAM-dependent DNA methyltransferase [Clostridia bacterium]
MNSTQQREAARQFFYRWKDRGREDEDARSYWIELLTQVFGAERVTERLDFEKKVIGRDGNTKRIDVYIPETRTLIEQKSFGIDLDKPQAGHEGMTPFEQARMYSDCLPLDGKPRWIIVSNFGEIRIYDMNAPRPEQSVIKLPLIDLPDRFNQLAFLVNPEVKKVTVEMELSLRAGELVGRIHDRFLEKYHDPMAVHTQRSLNILCVRLVFCLYAEDAGLFGGSGDEFSRYIAQYEPKDIRRALIDLFKVLDTPYEEREDLYLSDELAAFPYVNGGLFQDENIVIPQITDTIKKTLLESANFDWSRISPTIFGAVFESTLNPETRRSGGMHYTSIENIHKVIDPLFLDALKAELAEIRAIPVERTREAKLRVFQDKLAGLRFLDPAAGSGNFLTETYLCLRRLENEVIEGLYGKNGVLQIRMGFEETTPIKVSIAQFYGIEINDFAVAVAKTALWIAESQMMRETETIVNIPLDFLPLKTQAGIVEGNALRLDWNKVVPKEQLSYIMGNPPFVGYSLQSPSQKNDILSIYVDSKGKPYKDAGKIDYVAGWYWKASQMMHNTEIRTALVSTNSITQGEQVASVWKPLYERFGIHIDFAYRTFRWDSEANLKAQVHCVIIGFSVVDNEANYTLFSEGKSIIASMINPYLVEADTVFIESRTKPLFDVPVLQNGGKPTEGGYLILTEEEKNDLISSEPQSEGLIRPYMMGKDFILRKPRYCLWLVHADPSILKQCPSVIKRIECVRDYRLASPKEATRRKAETPTLFDEVRECKSDYVAIPKVSSERRRYIPIDYLSKDIIPGDKLFMIEDSTVYHFGIIVSNVHMAWMRAVAGRLKSDYSYSNTIVYNNFPWPTPTEDQKARIEQTAQAILDARALYPDASLADLYDELTMPPELRKAHRDNDKAVMEAYGMDVKTTTESSCVAELMRRYQEMTG